MKNTQRKLDMEANLPCHASAPSHPYISTACQHGLGEGRDEPSMCRFLCKFCRTQCVCPCHGGTTEPYPGYDYAAEIELRQYFRQALESKGFPPGARGIELLLDIAVTSVERLKKENPHG